AAADLPGAQLDRRRGRQAGGAADRERRRLYDEVRPQRGHRDPPQHAVDAGHPCVPDRDRRPLLLRPARGDAVSRAAAAVELTVAGEGRMAEVLTPEALAFVESLHREFDGRRRTLLERRRERQAELDAGALPDFLPETRALREREWQIEPVPADLQD